MEEIVAVAKSTLALCDQHGITLADRPQLELGLERAHDKRQVLVEVLQALYAAALHEQHHPPDWAVQAFQAGVDVAWRGQGSADRLASGLYPRCVALLGLQRRIGDLTLLVDEFAVQIGMPHCAPLAAALLRQFRRLKAWPQSLRLLALLAPTWRSGRPWAGEFVLAMALVARETNELADLGSLRHWAAALGRALAGPALEPRLRATLLRNLPVVARRTVDLPMMRQLCSLMVGEGVDDEQLDPLLQMLTLLQQFDHFPRLRELLRQLTEQRPDNAELRVLLARSQVRNGHPTPQALIELIEPLSPDAPGCASAWRWLAGVLFHMGADSEALAWYRRADQQAPLGETQRIRLLQLTARLEPGHPDAAALLHGALRFDAATQGPWAAALQPLAGLMNLPLTQGSEPDAPQIEAQALASLQHFERGLAGFEGLQIEACLRLARSLVAAADASLRRTATRLEAMQVPAGPAYGTLEPRRHRAVLHAVYRHVVLLCEHALARQPLLQGSGQVRVVLELAVVLAEQMIALGEAARVLRRLQDLQQQLRGVGAEVLLRLAERCELETGALDVARETGRRAGNGEAAETLAQTAWAGWAACQPAELLTLAADEARSGHFEYVRGDGQVHRESHRLPPLGLQAVAVAGLVVRSSFMAIAAQGGLLRPAPWHLTTGDYPHKALSVINRGQAGATLTRPARLQHVAQPVLVLGNMDAIVHRNYHRWMLLTLTRVLAASQAGLLKGRKLLLPAELAPWMNESLAAIGIAPHQIKTYTREQNLVLDDALVLQPLESAPPSLVASLRERLLKAALGGEVPAEPQRMLLFVSRKDPASRQMVDEDQVLDVAGRMGFELVDPRALGVLEQVRLFASARGVAGAPGASLANLIFAPPGVRVLALYKEEECLPTYAELALLGGQHYRWLLGRSDDRFSASASARMPYSIDPALLRRELTWVRDGAG